MESSKLQSQEFEQEEKSTVLSVEGIYKNYGKHNVLNDVSFSVKEGEVLGLIGPNGAGKTTTLRIITGLLAPTKGKVTICGKDIKKQREKALSSLSCIIESPAFYENLSGLDHMNFISSLHKTSKEQEETIIEEIGLKDRIKEKVKVYSLGMKQRLGIGLCLASPGDLSDYTKEPLKSLVEEENLLFEKKLSLPECHYVDYMNACIQLNNLYLSGKPEETKQYHPSKANLIAENEKYSLFLKEGITPVSENYSNNAAFYALRSYSKIPFFLLILLVSAIASDCFTREKEKDTSKLLFTQPLKITSVVRAKFLSLWIYCTAAAALVTTAAAIISGFIFGFGDLRYPIFCKHQQLYFNFRFWNCRQFSTSCNL